MTPFRHFGVMGGGAVGCLYGGWLAKAGAQVSIVARPRHVDTITADGLRVSGRDFDFRVPVRASTDPASLASCDVILFCTKTRDTEHAAAALKPSLPASSVVLAFQNGVDGAERLAAVLSNPVFPAALFVSCHMEGPGHVRHNGRGDVVLGEWFSTRVDAADRRAVLYSLARMFTDASIPTSVSDDVRKVLWTKLAMNCGYNALSALGRARYERLVAEESSARMMKHIVDELVIVGRADGVDLDRELVWRQVFELANGMPRAISSTGQDIAAGRSTEIEDLNGYVVRRGEARGIATPFNETMVRLIRILESAPYDPAFFPNPSAS